MVIVGGVFGGLMGVILCIMTGVQLYTVATTPTPSQILQKHRKREQYKHILQNEDRFAIVFGDNRWTWLLPIKPNNNAYDPHFANQIEEVMLPDYEELPTTGPSYIDKL